MRCQFGIFDAFFEEVGWTGRRVFISNLEQTSATYWESKSSDLGIQGSGPIGRGKDY